jgi:hypothetical protein
VFDLAWIDLKSRFLWGCTILTRVAMRFDGVSESSSGYNRPAEHGHGHGQAEGPEPSDADEGLADRG